MKVLYYSQTHFLDHVLPQVRAVSRSVELHVLLEVAPDARRAGVFDGGATSLPPGVVPADSLLRGLFPPAVSSYWSAAASFHLSVHRCQRSLHPTAWREGRRVAGFIRAVNPDVVHLDDLSLRAAWAVLGLGRIPIVLTLHDPVPHSDESDWRNGLARRLVLPRVARFVVHSTAVLPDLCNALGVPAERVSVVPLGVLEVFRHWGRPSLPADDRTVLFFGRLSPYKGLEVLYEAAPLVARVVPGVRFVVAGSPIRGYTPPAPPALPNGGRVDVLSEFISNARLAELFQRATVVVCPYVQATQSGVVLTAYAFGRPVIATTSGGLPEYVLPGETGLLVPPGDPDALSEAIVNVLQDRVLRNRFLEGVARVAEERFHCDNIGRQMAHLYQQVALSK